MPDHKATNRALHAEVSWIDHNIIDAAPLWIALYRSALTNVRVRWEPAMPATPATARRPSARRDAPAGETGVAIPDSS